jgi:hypothetical protein
VYGLIITASKPIHLRGEPDENLGFALMRTCRQIYEETLPFFYRNNFSISELSPKLKSIITDIQTNLREVTFDWRGYKIKDRATLKMFLGCSKLKILHIKITQHCVTTVVDPYARRQWLYQDDVNIKKFNRLNGFDNLVRLRGLDRVTVRNSKSLCAADVSNQEIADFEAFLTRILTLPKPEKKRSVSRALLVSVGPD